MNTLTHLGDNNWPYQYSREGWRSLGLNRENCKPALSSLAVDIMNLRRQPATEVIPRHSFRIVPRQDSPSTNLRMVSFGLCEDIKREYNWGFDLSPPMNFIKSRVHTIGGQQGWMMQHVIRGADGLDSDLEPKEFDIDELAHDIGHFEMDEVQW